MAIIEAILAGERDRHVLTGLCHGKVLKTKKEFIFKALEGRYTESGLFALRQAHEAYLFYLRQIEACDRQIETVLNRIGGGTDHKPQKRKAIRHHKPAVDKLAPNLLNVFEWKDATLISGITDYTWMQLLAETGSDLTKWPTEKHFTSWLGLAPGQHHSGMMRRNAKKKGHPTAGGIFRTIAQGLINSKNIAIGSFGRRLRGRKGPKIAIKAMARKVAILYWRVMVKGLDFAEQGTRLYEQQIVANKINTLNKLVNELNGKYTINVQLT
jgi:transposase